MSHIIRKALGRHLKEREEGRRRGFTISKTQHHTAKYFPRESQKYHVYSYASVFTFLIKQHFPAWPLANKKKRHDAKRRKVVDENENNQNEQ